MENECKGGYSNQYIRDNFGSSTMFFDCYDCENFKYDWDKPYCALVVDKPPMMNEKSDYSLMSGYIFTIGGHDVTNEE